MKPVEAYSVASTLHSHRFNVIVTLTHASSSRRYEGDNLRRHGRTAQVYVDIGYDHSINHLVAVRDEILSLGFECELEGRYLAVSCKDES